MGKMPGDQWQRFANLRALYAWMWSHPGKQLPVPPLLADPGEALGIASRAADQAAAAGAMGFQII